MRTRLYVLAALLAVAAIWSASRPELRRDSRSQGDGDSIRMPASSGRPERDPSSREPVETVQSRSPIDSTIGEGEAEPEEGIVRGLVVDEIDGSPVPFLEMSVDGEDLVTDARGAFVTLGRHAGGRLEFRFSDWSHEIGWSPEHGASLVVPARVGPTFYLTLDRSASGLAASWLPPGSVSSASACGVDRRAFLRVEPPTLVRYEEARHVRPGGEVVLVSYADHLSGWAKLEPGRGTESNPIPVSLTPCGFLTVSIEASRELEWYEDERMTLRLLSRAGDLQASLDWELEHYVFVVREPGQHRLEARYEGEEIGHLPVTTRLGESTRVVLPISLPELEAEEEPIEPTASLHATVTSARNVPVECQLRLVRHADDEELLIQVRWSEEGGGSIGHADGEAPAGEYRVTLELDTPFEYSGPATVRVPDKEGLVFALDDDVPLVDVYFAPNAAESGLPLLAFDAEASLAGGQGIGSADFWSPSVPALEGIPRSVPFFWICSAPGRRPVCGRWEPDGGEGDLHLAVTLERGWGTTLYVGDANHAALEGVRVFCDGVPAELTDASGHACIGGERPGKIFLEYRDWVLDPEDLCELEPDGAFDDSKGFVRAFLAPPGLR